MAKKRHPGDRWLPIGVVLTAVVLTAALFALSGHGKQVQVSVKGEVVAVLPLDKDAVYPIIGEGGNNQLIIEQGKAFIREADCPDKLCVRQGGISLPGQSVVCLPHQVVVTVLGTNAVVDGEV